MAKPPRRRTRTRRRPHMWLPWLIPALGLSNELVKLAAEVVRAVQ